MYTTSTAEPRARKFQSGNRISNSTQWLQHLSACGRTQPNAFRSYIKTSRSSHPFFIFVVVNPHHLPASQPDQRQRGRQNTTIWPGIEDAYLGLGQPERRFDRRLKV